MAPKGKLPADDFDAQIDRFGGLSVGEVTQDPRTQKKRKSEEKMSSLPSKRPREYSSPRPDSPSQPAQPAEWPSHLIARPFTYSLIPGRADPGYSSVMNKAFTNMIEPVPHGYWTYGRELGSGSYGTATVYYHLDAQTGRVNDRITVKDCFVPVWNWALWTGWHGDPRDPSERKHIEIQALWDIQQAQERNELGAKEMLSHLGHCTLDDRFYYRVITPFMQHGDLGGAFPKQPHDQQTRVHVFGGRITDGSDVPEPVIWKWLEDLAKACMLMSNIEINDGQKPKVRKWLIHRDIKPGNIFLGGADPNEWPSYPKAIVGDLGGTIYTDALDQNNPLVYNVSTGTEGYKPIELTSMYSRSTLAASAYGPLTPATNIWQVGCSLIRLINRRELVRNDPSYATQFECNVTIDPHAVNYYSPQLIATLRKCVKFQSHERIKPQDLLQECRRWTGLSTDPNDKDLANGMRTRKVSPRASEEEQVLNWPLFPSAKYRLGFSLMNQFGQETYRDEPLEDRQHLPRRPEPVRKGNNRFPVKVPR